MREREASAGGIIVKVALTISMSALPPATRASAYGSVRRVAGMPEAGEQDTLNAALTGKLGQSEAAVQGLFGAVDRRAMTRKGQWLGRSYLRDGRTLTRVDPKAEHVRVRVGTAAYERAPAELRGSYRQHDWLVVRLEDREVGLRYVRRCWPHKART